jgi:hypothetical protein
MSIILDGSTGISSIGTLTGVTSIGSAAVNTPTIMNDSGGTQVGTLCRAWVNFNGTGTVAIRASFNVTSITDNGTGNYTINFTNALPDVNYCAVMSGKRSATDDGWCRTEVFNTTTLQVVTSGSASNARADWEVVSVAIFD